jgi:NAD-dependent SIR2 family protein deacetylase
VNRESAAYEDAIKRAASIIEYADTLLITAGAGMGVDSGLPDFRGDQGFWRAYPALKGYSFVDMANPRWFESDPHRAWGFYGHRLNLYRATIPHQGFSLLKNWSDAKQSNSFIFTSNVDGQFQRAGFNPNQVWECHGSIHHLQGFTYQGKIVSAEGIELNIDEEQVRLVGDLPQHPEIQGPVRPNILMFGDGTWNDQRCEQQEQRFDDWLDRVQEQRIAVIEMGAGTALPSVRRFGENIVMRLNSALLIRINLREPQFDRFSSEQGVSIGLGALEALTHINEHMNS